MLSLAQERLRAERSSAAEQLLQRPLGVLLCALPPAVATATTALDVQTLARAEAKARSVLQWHRLTEERLRAERERAARERMSALRTNDLEAYARLVRAAKSDRLTQLLGQTDVCLATLASRLRRSLCKASAHFSAASPLPTTVATSPKGTKDPDAFAASSSDWNRLAEGLEADVPKQPAMLRGGQLRDYQLTGLRWLVALHDNGLNGILADEMGLGKTIQVIAFLAHLAEARSERGPWLIVAPASLQANWEAELTAWAPDLAVLAYKGSAQAREAMFMSQMLGHKVRFNVVLTTYEYLMGKHDVPRLSRIPWTHIIIDEGHRLKNAGCKLNMELRRYKAKHRLLLTGTPLQNNLTELWSLLNFIMPELFGSSDDFQQWFACTPSLAGSGSDAALLSEEETLLITNRLHQVLRPFILRRLKESVAAELPEKVERLVLCPASAYQRALCGIVEQGLLQAGGAGGAIGVRGVANSLMELRNICNHPLLSRLHAPGGEHALGAHPLPPALHVCGKLATLDRVLLKLTAAGHKVLIFSTMTRLLDIVEEHLEWRGLVSVRLDGATASDERGAVVAQFNDPNGDVAVFLLSMRAGGFGLNLQAADTVIMYDTDWNPQVDQQAQARAHRVGQTKQVLVLRMQTADSVEARICAAAAGKLSFADRSITGGFFDGKTSAEERRTYLLGVMRAAEPVAAGAGAPDAAGLNALLARSEAELAQFAALDAQLDAQELAAWHAAGGDTPYARLATVADAAAARMLSDYFDEVVLLERDHIDLEHQVRSKRGGVPQYAQPHTLLVRGLQAMESFFPGFGDDLVAAGAQRIDWLRDLRTWDFGAYNQTLAPGEESPLQGISSTRALLERTFRSRVLALCNLTLRAGTPATRLRLSPGKERVVGVELRGGEVLPCEMLVDASGRGSKLPECLAAEGRPLVGLRRDVVDSGLGYATRTLAIPPNWQCEKGWLACSVSERTKDKVGRAAVMLPTEGNSWQLILAGRAGDHPPGDEEGFKAFARSLPTPDIYDTICAAEPRSAISLYARTQNERKHYESVDMPDGLAVLGDAACCFNPIYGQGMTVGILGALELQQVLATRLAGRRGDRSATIAALAGVAKEFQPKLSKLQDFPWSVATADDESFLVATGKKPPVELSALDKLIAGYFSLACRAAAEDMGVAVELFSVSHLLKPPSALFAPGVALRVARLALGDALGKLVPSLNDVEAAILFDKDSCSEMHLDRALYVRRARLVTYLSLGITLMGGGLGLFLARLLNSAAVLGFALESFVDVWSSVLVLYRFWDDKVEAEATRQRERLASLGISITFVGIGLLVGAQALANLREQTAPQGGPLLLGMAAVSALALSALCAAKWRLSEQLRSESLRKDAVTSGAVAVLSVAILLSSGLHARNAALWWFDSLVALVVAAARMLSDYFDEVVLLERDHIDLEHQVRSKRGGVPQYFQPHTLLVGGLQAMESFFPGFGDDLVAAGAQRIDWLRDMRTWDFGAYNQTLAPGEESPLQVISSTRALLERMFRSRVLALCNLTLRAGTPATRLRLSPDKDRVVGVELRGGEVLPCELLVDASGRGSKLPECLAAEGRPLVGLRRDVVDSGLGYATRMLAIPPNWQCEKGWLACSVSERTKDKVGRAAMMLPIEGNSWQLILAGRAGDHPPGDEEGFKAFARSLPTPDMYDTICAAEPRSTISLYARTQNERKHYESVDMPDGLAVLGDAACCFNPVYGQGMTVGILGALELQQVLATRLAGRRGDRSATIAALAGVAKEFQPKLSKLQDFPWSVATADDESFLVATGKKRPVELSALDKLNAGYFSLACRAAAEDMGVAVELVSVSHLLKPPSALFAPGVALRVARLALGDALGKLVRGDAPKLGPANG
ncbi:hypothetical protein WJX81_004004 [Elliptochloris bilobata]|uniref:Uncharacterized protein n=1 Tax=Elliptochloris bilobata TaxID=381761 RepID=A0AAW1R1N7_9CHLO